MPTFQYQALDTRGKKKKGFIEAESKAKAFSLLQDQSLLPLTLSSVNRKGGDASFSFGNLRDMLMPSRIRLGESFHYLGLLLQTGSSLAQALDLMGRMAGRKAGRIWLNLRDAVETGEAFSSALKRYPRDFPKVYVGMVQVAESVGRLGQVLEKVSEYEEQRSEVSGRLMTAMVYPAVIFLVGCGAIWFLLSQVLPKIATIFVHAHKALPLHTQVLITVGDFLNAMGPGVLLAPVALALGAVYAYKRKRSVAERVDRLVWQVPLFKKNTLARFAGMLGFQLEAGIPLVQALDSSAMVVGSVYFQNLIRMARAEVAAGQPLDKVLERQNAFPDIFLLTLSTGQRAGKLGPFLLRVSHIYEKDVDNTLKRLVSLLEPLLILAIGMMVAFIVLAIMGPIFDLTTMVR
ncbi:MAG: type II secretion system F family protein [Desulfovibrionaceae bacterium]